MRISDWSSDVCSSDLRVALLVDRQIAVEHADPAKLRHHDRHIRLGDGIHRRGQDRDVERDLAAEAGAGIGLARQHARFRRLQQNVVEGERSEEHTSELQSLMRISYAVFCLKKKKENKKKNITQA